MKKYIIVYYKSDAPHGYEECMRSLPMTKEDCHRHLIKNEFFENPVLPRVWYPKDKTNAFAQCELAQVEEA